MKNYIKLVVIALFAVATLSAQTTILFNNEMPETWKPDMSNSHTRKLVNPHQTQQQYTPAEFSKGRSYNVLNTENRVNTPTSATLQNNNSSSYYRSYGVNHSATQNITYNTPAQIEQLTINAAETTPFSDIVTTSNAMYVQREDTPDDPSQSTPIGNVTLPLLLITIAYIAFKQKK